MLVRILVLASSLVHPGRECLYRAKAR
jgi:hypothetical protein